MRHVTAWLRHKPNLHDALAALVVVLALIAAVFASQSAGKAIDIPGPDRVAPRAAAPAEVAPPTPAPPVEPVQYAEIAPEDAVAVNAKVPFSTDPNPAARPFKLAGSSPETLARSTDCLAAAAYYEASAEGDDGMRAVAQVVINRLRHPAFPKTVCGVVFQGSERATGCQFTFTCDGALARTPSVAGWKRAREIAAAALGGKVYKPVGHSTHYHTNWVVPYWSSSLDKVTQVGTHLFFRWTGWWGTPGAFRGAYEGAEPVVAKIASLSPAHASGDGATQLAELPAPALRLGDKGARSLDIVSPGGDAFVVVLDKKVNPNSLPGLALSACGDKEFCKFMAWTDATKAPRGFPIMPREHEALSFSYLRNRSNGFEKVLWNCREFARPDQSQCMKSF
jgi:spore germination cell wall hydrolase CwlJ-like protein